MPHLMISAAHKSSGKTTFSVALSALLVRRGLKIQAFKKGPDYIDGMWLTRATGRPTINLDYNTMGEEELLATYSRHAGDADLALIEGNKGLYDGLDPAGGDSNAALARLLGAPVVLVLDTLGMTRGIAPLVLGYQTFEPDIEIAGIVLNKVGGARQEAKLRAALERYTDIPVLGAIGRDPSFGVAERHMGLVTPCETEGLDEMIEQLADTVAASVDVDQLLVCAAPVRETSAASAQAEAPTTKRVWLGVARDAAFGFYYADDLTALADAGAEIVPFNSLTDPELPVVDGLFIGGGFPETQMAALEANQSLRTSILSAAQSGMPIYAECGGLLYLSRSIAWRGERREMVGAIPADAEIHTRPQGRGYVKLQETGVGPWSLTSANGTRASIPAHEFHYAALSGTPNDLSYAYKVLRGAGVDGQHDGIVIGNLLASFSHLRHTVANPWANRFVDFVDRCKRGAA